LIGFLLVGSACGVSDFRASPLTAGSAIPESCREVSALDGLGDGVRSANENEDERRSSLGSS
jgi:hypothetical protein